MRPKKQTLSAAGSSNWVPISQYVDGFGISIGVTLSEGANLTYSVQHSFDNTSDRKETTFARIAGTATAVFKEPHNKSVGDSIVVESSSSVFSGTHEITNVPDPVSVQYSVPILGDTSASGTSVLLSVFDNDDLKDQTQNGQGNYLFPPSAIRLTVSSYTSGVVEANYIFQGKA